MATLTAAKVAAGVQPRISHEGVTCVTSTYALTAALAAADVIQMVKVPIGAVILDVSVQVPDLDTNGTPTITFTVGDGSDVDRYITSSTSGQTGGLVRMNSLVGLGYTYSAEDTIDLTVGTGPATGAASGTITLTVLYAREA